MFIGHFALGFAAKKAVPKASLAALLAAPQVLDLLWPIFLLAGIETVRIDPGNTAFTPMAFEHYPWSHSLLMAAVWGILFALGFLLVTRYTAGAAAIFFLVASHWVLDWVTHRPDMPLSPWSATRLGLGLWNSVPATLVIESALFACGVGLYARATRPRDRAGRWAFIALVVFLVISYLAAAFAPPPPDPRALAWGGLSLWIFPFWGWWIDRHREAVIPA